MDEVGREGHKDVGMDVGEEVGLRMGMEEEVVGEEAGKAGDEGCAPCMPAQVLPPQLWSIWLWRAGTSVVWGCGHNKRG